MVSTKTNNSWLRFDNESSIVVPTNRTVRQVYNEVSMGDTPEESSKLEKINHVMRIVLGVVSVLVFVVGLIAFIIKYSGH
jgi:hypothetical protein